MPNKRRRFQHPPSLRDVCGLDQVKPIEPSAKLEVFHCASNASRSFGLKREQTARSESSNNSSIFTLGSTVGEWEFDKRTRYGEFLKYCYACLKRIGEKDEVFMYNDLGAFCSPECRHRQITVDNLRKALAEKPPKSSESKFELTCKDLKCNVDLSLETPHP